LFPAHESNAFCYGDSVFHPNKAIKRRVTSSEMRRWYDIPLALDSVLGPVQWNRSRAALPFEFSLSSNMWAIIFRAIWGNDGGYLPFLAEPLLTRPYQSPMSKIFVNLQTPLNPRMLPLFLPPVCLATHPPRTQSLLDHPPLVRATPLLPLRQTHQCLPV
jgi:hypothetical protein